MARTTTLNLQLVLSETVCHTPKKKKKGVIVNFPLPLFFLCHLVPLPPTGFLQPWEGPCTHTLVFPPELHSPCTQQRRGVGLPCSRSSSRRSSEPFAWLKGSASLDRSAHFRGKSKAWQFFFHWFGAHSLLDWGEAIQLQRERWLSHAVR